MNSMDSTSSIMSWNCRFVIPNNLNKAGICWISISKDFENHENYE
jgi:hypothetical protein